MLTRFIAVATCLLHGCRHNSEAIAPDPSSPVAEQPAPNSDVEERRGLPELPPDLVGALGEARDEVLARHVAPQPRLNAPLSTKAEHQAWIDRELEPWREQLFEVGAQLHSIRPEVPRTAVGEAELAAFDRKRLVHTVLAATLSLDETTVRVRIPYPRELQEDPSTQADARRYAMITLVDALDTADLWKDSCSGNAAGFGTVHPDLEPWAQHCIRLVEVLVESVCEAEQAHGLPASVTCGGERPRRVKKPRRDDSMLSVAEMAKRAEQAFALCNLAEDVVDDDTIARARRVKEWRGQFEDYGIELPALVSVVDGVLMAEERGDAAATIEAGVREMGFADWECAAVETLFESED